jgi:hypothetical protein
MKMNVVGVNVLENVGLSLNNELNTFLLLLHKVCLPRCFNVSSENSEGSTRRAWYDIISTIVQLNPYIMWENITYYLQV